MVYFRFYFFYLLTLCMTQVIFTIIVYRQIISLIIHCITFPVGQKFTYTQSVFGCIDFKLFNLGQTFGVAFHMLPTISWVNFGPFLLTELV
jgi:hypothetical protein